MTLSRFLFPAALLFFSLEPSLVLQAPATQSPEMLAANTMAERMPILFEPNRGQSASPAQYLVNQRSGRIALADGSISYMTARPGASALPIRLEWAGDHGSARWMASRPAPSTSNYFFGATRITSVPQYAELREINVIPGVDLRYYTGAGGDLEYDIELAPGVDLSAVRLRPEGVSAVALEADGSLVVRGDGAELRQASPHFYELRGTKKIALAGAYTLSAAHEIGFTVSGRTPGRRMIIDPVLQYATYVGGKSISPLIEGLPSTVAQSVAVDPAGNFFIAGLTGALDFPVTPGAYQTRCPDGSGACAYSLAYFITKFSRSGQLLYSTYLTGPNGTRLQPMGKMLAVDANGIAYLAGSGAPDFPTTANAYQRTCSSTGDGCAVLVKLSASGSQLLYSSFFGGSQTAFPEATTAHALTIGQGGDIYLVGATSDPSLPVTAGGYQARCPPADDGGCQSGFVARFNLNASAQSSLVFASYTGVAGGKALARGVAADRYGDMYVLGTTTAEMPHLAEFGSGVAPYYVCSRDWQKECFTFLLKLSGRDGHALRAATLLKGASGTAIAVDSALTMFVAGAATYGLPTTAGAAQAGFGGGTLDAFVARLSTSGDALLFSTYMGGSGDDYATDLALNASSMPFFTGWSASMNLPVTASAFKKGGYTLGQLTHTAYVAALRADGKSLVYSSYLGGSSITGGNGIAVDPLSNAYVAGETSDADFAMTPAAVQAHLLGSSDAFVAKIAIAGDLGIGAAVAAKTVARNSVIIVHARIANYGPDGSDTVLFSNAIPPGLAYVGVYVPNGNGCSEPAKGATSGKLTCLRQRLENGQTYYVNVYYKVVGARGSRIVDSMSVTASTQDLWPGNNAVSSVVTVQ